MFVLLNEISNILAMKVKEKSLKINEDEKIDCLRIKISTLIAQRGEDRGRMMLQISVSK